jgi:hypothetical protein
VTPTGQTVTLPNTLQAQASALPSAGAAVNATNSVNWNATGGGGGGTLALRGHCKGTVGGGSTKTCLLSSTSVTGDALVVGVLEYNASLQTITVTDTCSSSWTNQVTTDNGTHRQVMATAKANCTGSNTITVTYGASVSDGNVFAVEISGTNATPFDVAQGQNAPLNSASMVTPSATTSATTDACVGFFSDATGSGAPTPGSSWTTSDVDSSFRCIMEYQVNSTGAVIASATDPTSTSVWQAQIACVKGAGALPFASVSQTGLVTSVSAGTATIAAQGGATAQANSQSFPASTSTATVTFNQLQTSGNANVVALTWTAATGTVTSVADTAGNTYTAAGAIEAGNGLSSVLYIASPIVPYVIATGNTVTVTMGQATNGLNVAIAEFTFPIAGAVQDGAVVNSTGASGPAVGTLTTVNATDEVVCATATAAGQLVNSTAAPFGIVIQTPGSPSALISAPAYSAGAVASSSTLSGGGYAQQCAALKVLSGSTSVVIAAQAVSSVYYISPANYSPPGNDGNSGTTPSAPFLTWAKVFSTLVANCPSTNGCTVFPLGTPSNPAIYSTANGTGWFQANCATGGNVPNGTSSAPIIIQALNERGAFIQGNGQEEAFILSNCAYWQVIGLHAESADFNVGNTFTGDVMAFFNYSNITIQRNILARPNRFGNVMPITMQNTTNSKLIENEIYYFHRWGIMDFSSPGSNEFLRNYINSRGYPDISGGYPSSPSNTGDFCLGPYTTNSDTFENNICENTNIAFNNENNSSNNVWLGNIASGTPQNSSVTPSGGVAGLTNSAFRIGPHVGQTQPLTNTSTNDVCIFPGFLCFWNRGGTAIFDHDTALGGGGFSNSSQTTGFLSDTDSCCTFGSYGQVVTNSVAQIFNRNPQGTGYRVTNTTCNTFSFDHDDNIFNTFQYVPNSNVTNPSTVNGGLAGNGGTFGCMIWIPTASPLHGAGSSGDIGANVLFEYSGGSITATPIWSTAASCKLGQTDCFVGTGAIVPGLNDVPTSSLFDIGNRINVNKSQCSYPVGYTPAS